MYLAVGTTVITTVVGIVAAYPLRRATASRIQIWFVYALAFMASLPIIALMIPTYDFYVSANFINSKFWTVWFLDGHIAPVRHVGRPFVHSTRSPWSSRSRPGSTELAVRLAPSHRPATGPSRASASSRCTPSSTPGGTSSCP